MNSESAYYWEKVEWRQDNKDYPCLIYAELNSERFELRKIEIYPDGKNYQVSSNVKVDGPTKISVEAWPALQQIAKDEEFIISSITKQDFEVEWMKNSLAGER